MGRRAIPTAIVAWAVWRHRPDPLGWLLIAIAVATPMSWIEWLNGNLVIWAVAAVAVATHRPTLGPLMLVKPTLFPVALIGSWTGGWWLVLAVGRAYAAVWLPLWPQFLTVLGSASSRRVGLLHTALGDASVLAIPVIAWLAATPRRVTALTWRSRSSGRLSPFQWRPVPQLVRRR